MPREVTLAQLRTAVRRLSDTEGDPHKSDAEITDRVNEARGDAYDILRRADPDFYEKTQTIITTGTDTYPLPDDHQVTKGVEWLSYSGWYSPLKRVDYKQRLDYQLKVGYATAFRIVGGNLVLYPPPPTGQTYRHSYTPAAITLVNDTDTVDGREARLIQLKAAILILIKEEGDTAPLERELEREVASMTASSEDRASLDTRTIADVEDYSDRAIWLSSLPRPPRP